MRTALLLALGLVALSASVNACGPVVETVPGVFPCEATGDCDDDNDCTVDVCENRKCHFYWHKTDDGKTCVSREGGGACASGECR